MGEERLCGLAMLHVHRDMNVSTENILRLFDETGHRTIVEHCILNDNSCIQIIPTTCIVHCRTIVLNLFRFAFFIEHNHYVISFFLKP